MRALVLGGYGNFGRIIAGALAGAPGIELVVAGRDEAKARRAAGDLGCEFAAVDANDAGLADRLVACGAQLVISTAGPFQGQDYRVARAAIAAKAHYLDIADGRDFVCGIGVLDDEAQARDVLVVSGASSVPALSSAVVDRYAPGISGLRSIDIGICTSSRIPGDATVRAILGYCGRPIRQWREGRAQASYGWQRLRRHRFREAPMTRWLCDCDVPDLEILPARYPGVRDVRFSAGLQPGFVHLGLWALSGLVRARLLPELGGFAAFLARTARSLESLGSDRSAMFVHLEGIGSDGGALARTWELVAENHEGANIPCMGAVSLARKLASGRVPRRGALACVGLVTLDEYLQELRPFRVRWGCFDADG
jgi:hypothetical protein